MLSQIASVTLRLMFFRAGPQDLPFNPALTRVLVVIALLANAVLASITLSPGLAVLSAIGAIFGLSVATRTLLRLRKLENRYHQTFHALLTTSIAFAALMLLPMSQLMPQILEVVKNPELMKQGPEAIKLPGAAVMMFDLLVIWNFAVTAAIYRQAAGLRLASGILVALIISLSLLMFVGMATSVFGALLGLAPPAPTR